MCIRDRLHTVIRTRESVILDDASVQNPFSADEYLCQKRARSVLCLPLVKQSKLIGVLYLENNLASHVFTPAGSRYWNCWGRKRRFRWRTRVYTPISGKGRPGSAVWSTRTSSGS